MSLVGPSVIIYFSPNMCWSWRFNKLHTNVVDLVGVGDLKISAVLFLGAAGRS